jgi:hypothetical protein
MIESLDRPSTPIEIPRNVDHDDAAVAPEKQDHLQHIRAPVMQQILPPVVNHQLWELDARSTARM